MKQQDRMDKLNKAHPKEVTMLDLIERIRALEGRIFTLEREIREHQHLSNARIGGVLR